MTSRPTFRSRASVFARLGRWAARHPRLVLGTWLLLALLALPLAPRVSGELRAGGFTLDDLEAARARHVLEEELGFPASALVIVVRSETEARAGDAAFEAAVVQALGAVPEARYVAGIRWHTLATRQVSADGRTVYELVGLDLPPDDSPRALEPVQSAIRPAAGITTYVAGGPAFYGDIQAVSEADLLRSEVISLPLAALVLLLVFGSVVAAGLPLVAGGASVLLSLAALFLVASTVPMSIFVLNLATLVGLGLGVDYSLLLTSRFREELRQRGHARRPDGRVDRQAVEDAVAVTMATAGRAVFFSGLTVLLGLIGLMLFEFMILRSVGIAGAVVVGLAVAAALTLLPACLGSLGPRIDALALPRRLRAASAAGPGGPDGGHSNDGGWARLARWVMARPLRVFVPTLTLLVLLGLPFLHVRFNAPDATILPPGVPSRQAYDLLASEFGEGEFAPLLLAIRTSGPVTDAANVGRLYDYSRRLAADPRVSRVESIVDIDERLSREQYQLLLSGPAGIPDRFTATALAATTRGEVTVFTVFLPYGPNRPEARALVEELRAPGSPLAPPAGVRVQVGGGAAEVVDVVDRIAADFPRSAVFVVVSTYLVLFLLLRSVVLPAKALVMNALSITASFGALVWIFQDGNLSGVLGFVPLGFVETTMPVILFCVLFGLSMDYEVFLLSRMKEAYDQSGDNRQAVAAGLERSGRIVTSAALVVVVVASSFAFADIVLIKALGIGVAIAVALDATVVRALLVPATMRLLGDRNWWLPRRLRRFVETRLPVVESAALCVALAIVLAACSPQGRLLGVDPQATVGPPTPSPRAVAAPDPRPVRLPADDGAHDRLTEWWYYTGHLRTEDGGRFGFEYVIFRAERGDFPVSWASHLALTDEDGRRFRYDQRAEIGPGVDRKPSDGFDLAIVGGADLSTGPLGLAPPSPIASASPPSRGPATAWTMRGAGGRDVLQAASATAGFGLDLRLAPPAGSEALLHDGDGWIDFSIAGGSYYYSRPRLALTGTLTLDGRPLPVEGTAWFDHQWGDFITVGAGGWDWFAVNLDDGTDLVVSRIRDAKGEYPFAYGEIRDPAGRQRHLSAADIEVSVAGRWTSPSTGATYPAGWRLAIPSEALVVELTPTVADQELDTRPTTGVVYWEGSQVVRATRAGRALGGEAYVELTGYGPAGLASP